MVDVYFKFSDGQEIEVPYSEFKIHFETKDSLFNK
jgi:hypothetical protein